MNEINRQVTRARRRIFIGRFFHVLCWSLFAGLFVAAIGLTIPKIWALGLSTDQAVWNWNMGWIAGGAVLGLLTAIGGRLP